MATKYFINSADEDWSNDGNWFLDALASTPTTAPTASDDAILDHSPTSAALPAVCKTMTVLATRSVNIEVTTTDGATFEGDSFVDTFGIINGGATFNDTSYNGGTVNDGAVFSDTSYNSGAVNDGAVFSDSAYNEGTVIGGAVFNDLSYNYSGTCDTAVYAATAAAVQLAGGFQGSVSGGYSDCTVRIGINGSSILGVC